MYSLRKNPGISQLSRRLIHSNNTYRLRPSSTSSLISSNAHFHRNTLLSLTSFESKSRFCSISKEMKSPEMAINGSHFSTLDLNSELPGKPDFMEDDFESQELEVLGLHETEIKKQQAPDPRMFNPDYDPNYDPKEEDQIEVGGKDKTQVAQHRIIKSKIKEDVVIEAEAISSMERLYTWILLGLSVYLGMLAARFYFMRDRLKLEKEEIAKQQQKESKSINNNNDANTVVTANV